MNVGRVQEGLRTQCFGWSIILSRVAASTNDLAKKLAASGAADGTVVVAETQTRGRGRLNREWVSPAGGLWFSALLRPVLEPSHASRLVFVAGLAVAKTLRELYGLDVATKWPNDVLVNGKKVCGILAEMRTAGQRIDYVVLGVGVNADFEVRVLPEELWESATSLKTELGREISLEELFRALLESLETTYDLFLNQGFAPVLQGWKSFAGFLGKHVIVTNVDERWVGTALDVDNDGSLVLRLEDGTEKHVHAGDVSVRIR